MPQSWKVPSVLGSVRAVAAVMDIGSLCGFRRDAGSCRLRLVSRNFIGARRHDRPAAHGARSCRRSCASRCRTWSRCWRRRWRRSPRRRYVGRFGVAALGGMALVFPIVMLQTMLSGGAMGGAVSSAVSRALGAGDPARADALAVHAPGSPSAAGVATVADAALRPGALRRRWAAAARRWRRRWPIRTSRSSARSASWLMNTFASVIRGSGNMKVPSATFLAVSVAQVADRRRARARLGAAAAPRHARRRRRAGHRLRSGRGVPVRAPARRPARGSAAAGDDAAAAAHCSAPS